MAYMRDRNRLIPVTIGPSIVIDKAVIVGTRAITTKNWNEYNLHAGNLAQELDISWKKLSKPNVEVFSLLNGGEAAKSEADKLIPVSVAITPKNGVLLW